MAAKAMIVAHVSAWEAFWGTVILAAFLICCCAMFLDFDLKYREIRDSCSEDEIDADARSRDAA